MSTVADNPGDVSQVSDSIRTSTTMADEAAQDLVPDEPQSSAVPHPDDVVMGDNAEGAEGAENTNPQNSGDLPFAEGPYVEPRTKFVDYLGSPIVTLIVGSGDSETILTAHQALLIKSPYFAEICAAFTDDGSVSVPLSRG